MSEKSGMEILEELVQEVKRLNQKVDVMDRLLKQVANSAKISEIATKALNTPLKNWAQHVVSPKKNNQAQAVSKEAVQGAKEAAPSEGMRFKFEPTDAARLQQEAPNRAARRTVEPVMCMCEGKMVASNKGQNVPLPGVSVSIFNDKDELVKQTKTNRAGSWMSKLSPGRYVALCEGKYQGKALYPININFEVKPGMEKLEVV